MPANEILTRLLMALAIAAAGVALYFLANRMLLRRAQSTRIDLPGYQPGVLAVLYFTTPECMPCKTVQRPALKRVKDALGDRLNIIEVNAQERPDLASQWGVLSVPTTFIIDPAGKTRHINHGVTRAEKLLQQVTETDFEI